jgi:glycosyltransferase involved in cell wall biosynthesis
VTIYDNLEPNSEALLHLYQTSDIFVLPSRAEAFGIAAVEASASGLPVIATSSGGLSDIVVDGETGFLIPVGDVNSLAQHLKILVENVDLRQKMGQAACQRAHSRFDAQKNAARLAQILREIASEQER